MQSIHLTFREFELLRALILSDGVAIKRGDLLDQAWGEAWIGDPRTLDVHIHLLREKLEDDPSNPQFILTLRNIGYRLVSPRKFKK